MQIQSSPRQRPFEILAGVSLISLPLLLSVTFILHFHSIADFLTFQLAKPDYSAEHLLQTLTSADQGFRFFVLPHVIGYLSLPLFIFSAAAISYFSFRHAPKLISIGFVMTVFGTVFLGGVFGSWLSFAAINQANSVASQDLVAVLGALTTMQGPLLLSSLLSSLTFIGMIVLGVGLHRSNLLPRWSSVLYIIGNVMILVFMDLDNWMLLGAVLQAVGIFPLCRRLIMGDSNKPTRSMHPVLD